MAPFKYESGAGKPWVHVAGTRGSEGGHGLVQASKAGLKTVAVGDATGGGGSGAGGSGSSPSARIASLAELPEVVDGLAP